MNVRVVLLCMAMTLALATPAGAWDPDRLPPGAASPPAEEPAPVVDQPPQIAPPPGIYYVTDTYVADVVTSDGSLTTYATATVHESPGTYASVLETVGTGEASAFDGSSFNGRATLRDGRPVAGTYYRDWVLTDSGFVAVNVVFFQDDAELARQQAQTPTTEPAAPAAPPATAPAVPGEWSEPADEPVGGAPERIAPSERECCERERVEREPVERLERPAPGIRPGISLRPAGATLSRIEILRGRAISLWLRAFVDGRETAVRSWRLISGDAGTTSVTSGAGTTAFRTSWERLAPAGSAFVLRFGIVAAGPDGREQSVDAVLEVIVRSPALEA